MLQSLGGLVDVATGQEQLQVDLGLVVAAASRGLNDVAERADGHL